jgi:hypothetical protein
MSDKTVVLPNLFFDINQTDTETLGRLFKIWLRDWSLIGHNPEEEEEEEGEEEEEEELYSSAKRSFSPVKTQPFTSILLPPFFAWPSEF